MSILGLDYSLGRPNLDQAWAAGYRFVLRYLSWLPNPKCISAAELTALHGKGFEVALNWEYDALDALGGGAVGRTHATEAVSQARALNYPPGKTIYYSVDFDVTEQQQLAVDDYFAGAGATTHAADKRIGGYGGYWTIKRLFDAGLIDDGWQTYAWSLAAAGVDPGPHAIVVNLRGQNFWFDSRAALRQIQNGVTVGGADCDVDERVGTTYFMGQAPMPKRKDDDVNLLVADAGPSRVLAWIDPTLGKVWENLVDPNAVGMWRAAGAATQSNGEPFVVRDLNVLGREVGEARRAWAQEQADAQAEAAPGGQAALNITLSGTGTPAA